MQQNEKSLMTWLQDQQQEAAINNFLKVPDANPLLVIAHHLGRFFEANLSRDKAPALAQAALACLEYATRRGWEFSTVVERCSPLLADPENPTAEAMAVSDVPLAVALGRLNHHTLLAYSMQDHHAHNHSMRAKQALACLWLEMQAEFFTLPAGERMSFVEAMGAAWQRQVDNPEKEMGASA